MTAPETGVCAGADATGTSRKRRRALLIALLVGVLAGSGGFFYRLHTLHFETTDDAFVEGHVVFISSQVAGQVVKVAVEDNQRVNAGDLLVEIDPRDVQARLDQASAALNVARAQAKAAAAVLELTKVTAPADTQLAQAGLDVATAMAASAQIRVAMARSQEVQAKAQVQSAQARVEEADADAEAALAEATRTADDLVRYRALMDSESTTRQQLENAEAAAKSAAARLTAARKKGAASRAEVDQALAGAATAAEAIKEAQSRLEESQAGIAQASARLAQSQTAGPRVAVAANQGDAASAAVAQIEASVQAARLQLEYVAIRAPRDGYVTRRTVQEGAYMQPGQAMLTIVGTDLWVIANFKETQLVRMQPGQPVTVAVDACGGREFAAHVDSIQAGSGARFSLLPPENATGNFVRVVQRVPVKICFDEPITACKLGPGMSVVSRVKVR